MSGNKLRTNNVMAIIYCHRRENGRGRGGGGGGGGGRRINRLNSAAFAKWEGRREQHLIYSRPSRKVQSGRRLEMAIFRPLLLDRLARVSASRH
jgi:hypothetical protein